jgi:hypothetical protein
MSETRSTQPSQGPPAKARNPFERIIVYGVIVALVVLVGVEAKGRFSHKSAVDTITAMLQKTETDAKAKDVTETDIKSVLGSMQPTRTEQYPASTGFAASKKLEVYSWFSLNPAQKRELWIHYARKGAKEEGPATVISVSTDENEAKPVEVQASAPAGGPPGDPGEMRGPMGGGPGMSGPPGMRGGPPGGGPGGAGRPGAGAAEGEKPDGEKTDTKPDEDKPDSEKPDTEKKGDADQPEAKPE